jgi:hypothetical protein
MLPAARTAPQEACPCRTNYSPSQQMRLILFLPVGETDKTTSIFFPQLRQKCPLFLDPALAATSVFDFGFSAMTIPPFSSAFFRSHFLSSASPHETRGFPFERPLPDCSRHYRQNFTIERKPQNRLV